ncbi:heavy metal-associated isoprenylated plant protein 4 [Tanacetum coccineum]
MIAPVLISSTSPTMVAAAQPHQELQSMEALSVEIIGALAGWDIMIVGDDDNLWRLCFVTHGLRTPVSWLGSRTSIAVAAMASVPRGPTISCPSLAGYIDSIKQTCSNSSSRRCGKRKAQHDLGFEGFQMECRSAGNNVMAQEQDLRAKLLKHKGIHNVKTDIKSHIVVIEGTIESGKIVTYMHKRAYKHAVEFEEKIKVEAKGKDGDVPYFVHYVYAPELFTFG